MFVKCNCKDCSNEGTIRLTLRSRGGRGVYLCEYHAKENERYSFKNNNQRGLKKQNGFSFGMELETSSCNPQCRVELFHLGFVATRDGSIDDAEFKSSIWQGLNSPVSTFRSIEYLMDNNGLEMDDCCGTHFHVGNVGYDYAQREMVAEFYHELFDEMSKLIEANPESARAFWGRSTNDTDYAVGTHHIYDVYDHYSLVNIQHERTLEFRLAKFRSADQYTKVAHFAKAVMATILNNLISHYWDDDYDRSRYPAAKYFRRHKAEMTGRKIANLYRKAVAECGYIL